MTGIKIVDPNEGNIDHSQVTLEIGAEGSGDDLIKQFKAEEELARLKQNQDAHEAAVLCVMAATARLQALEVKRTDSIWTPEDEREYTMLRTWWNHIGEANQQKVAMKIRELAHSVYDLWRFF